MSKTLKQQFNELIKNLNNAPRQQEYIIYGSAETFKQMDDAVALAVERIKNPILDQPAQKWHYGDGFYMVLNPFGDVKTGDVILLKSYVHTRVVKIATATEKQVFFNWREDFKADMKFTPQEWQSLRQLTKWELLKIFPHLSDRIKHLHAYFAIMQFYPECVCSDCIKLLNLEIKEDWKQWHNSYYKKRCQNCHKVPAFTTFRNALKPIGL